jgi:hypothetical protein
MQKHVEPWMEICELAAREQNPAKLMKLTSEIIRLLDEKKKSTSCAEAKNGGIGT